MKTIEEQTAVEAYNYASKNTDGNHSMTKSINDFISGAQWERNRDRWISVKDEWPKQYQKVSFVIDMPGRHLNGSVYGGTFMGHRDDGRIENEFSLPGNSYPASCWTPLPEPPKQKEKQK